MRTCDDLLRAQATLGLALLGVMGCLVMGCLVPIDDDDLVGTAQLALAGDPTISTTVTTVLNEDTCIVRVNLTDPDKLVMVTFRDTSTTAPGGFVGPAGVCPATATCQGVDNATTAPDYSASAVTGSTYKMPFLSGSPTIAQLVYASGYTATAEVDIYVKTPPVIMHTLSVNCAAVCGDNTCNATETCSTCELDCGACPPVCGDRTCEGTETCSNCATDCGTCKGGPSVGK